MPSSLNQPEYEQLIALACTTTKAIGYSDEQLKRIILECGQDYLAGKKSLEDTVKVIQSRVSVFVAEKYG